MRVPQYFIYRSSLLCSIYFEQVNKAFSVDVIVVSSLLLQDYFTVGLSVDVCWEIAPLSLLVGWSVGQPSR